jgi:hypothetical protein
VGARERLVSFLGTLFVKQAIVGADEVDDFWNVNF